MGFASAAASRRWRRSRARCWWPPTPPARIGTTVDDTLVASYGPIVGASDDLGDAWRLGLTFRGVLEGQFNVVITVKDLGSIVVPPLNISGVAQYDPWQLSLELARVRGPWKVAVALTYKHWSAYPGAPEPTVRCVDQNGMPITPCGALVPTPPGYHDTLSPHIGVERTLAPRPGVDMALRAGFFFEPSPAPTQSSVSNTYDNHRAAVTLGYGVEVGPPSARVDLDLFGQAQALIPRDNVKQGGVPASNPGAPGFTVERRHRGLRHHGGGEVLMRRTFALTLASLFAFAPSLARANEADAYGLGSRATAMAGAVAADAEDFSGNYYNPAALVGVRGPSLSIGYVYVWNKLSVNGQDSGVANVHGLVGGLAIPGKLFGIPFAFGVGLYMPDTGLSHVEALQQQTPRWAIYDDRASIVFLAANLAVRPFSWLEVGGGAAFLAATKGTFQISGTANITNPYNSQLQHEVDADLSAVRYPQLGARITIPGFGKVAMVYRGQTKLDLQINAHLQGSIAFAGLDIPLVYDLATQTSDAFLPQQVVAGASFQRIPRLKVNFDLVFVNWAAYQSPTAVTTANLSVQLPPGTPITIPPNPKPVTIIAPNFANRFVPHFGAEYVVPVAGSWRHLEGDPIERRALEVPLRVGYVYEQTPVPPQTGVTNFVDTDRHTVSAGAGITLNKPGSVLAGSVTLDLHGQLSILPARVTQKVNPADFIGDYTAQGTMIGIGTTLTAVF